MRVSVVIPVHGAPDELGAVLAALARRQRSEGVELELVLVGDGQDVQATSGSWKQGFSRTVALRCERGGQSAATNEGVRHARGDLLWLLAQDMVPAPGALPALLEQHRAQPRRLVQGLILHDPEQLENHFVRWVVERSRLQFTFDGARDGGPLEATRHYAPNALLERAAFLTLGGYDEALPYGFQDTDLGLRLLGAGGEIVHAARAVVHHHHRYTVAGYLQRERRMGRAAVDFFHKWGREADLGRFRLTHRRLTAQLGVELETARRAALAFDSTGASARNTAAFRAPELAEGDPLDTAFLLATSLARLEGIEEGIAERGLDPLPPLPDRYQDPAAVATGWIVPLAEELGRRWQEEGAGSEGRSGPPKGGGERRPSANRWLLVQRGEEGQANREAPR